MNTIKNKLNIVGKCFVKENAVNGEILSFVPEVPISCFLDDLLIIMSIPDQDQKFSNCYIRLQNKTNQIEHKQEEQKEFTEVRSVGYIKESRRGNGDIIVCAPRNHVWIDLSKVVFIATIPSEDKTSAPFYARLKKYEKSKSELVSKNDDNVIIDVKADMNEEQVAEVMKDIEE